MFLHGWPGDHTLFEYQFHKLPKLGYRCIGIDTRGFGKSDKPFHGYDYDTLSDDVRGVADALDLHNFVLAGHSTFSGHGSFYDQNDEFNEVLVKFIER